MRLDWSSALGHSRRASDIKDGRDSFVVKFEGLGS